jgi:hypothetical protein
MKGATCHHCDLPIPEGLDISLHDDEGNQLFFCCRGCEGAFPDRIALAEAAVAVLADPAAAGSTGERYLCEAQTVLISHLQYVAAARFKTARFVVPPKKK